MRFRNARVLQYFFKQL